MKSNQELHETSKQTPRPPADMFSFFTDSKESYHDLSITIALRITIAKGDIISTVRLFMHFRSGYRGLKVVPIAHDVELVALNRFLIVDQNRN